ncbi:MAG TPA: hypothetical protein VMF06_03360 [Candidatus Limnocylindria bacterium]|nr:hypothetical protein [Candidatus Limnocylindria bacterium]
MNSLICRGHRLLLCLSQALLHSGPWPLLGILAYFGLAPGVLAHGSYAWGVTHQDPSRPSPVVDGVYNEAEYVSAWRLNLLYRPGFAWRPARMSLLGTSNDFYLCVQGMPQTVSGPGTFLSVAFDVGHTGGAVARGNHLVFNVYPDGHSEVLQGDGAGGFRSATNIVGWSAVRALDQLEWTVELRVPLGILGGGAPGSVLGFEVRQNWLRASGDDFAWPPTAYYNVPNTWGDLYWFGVPTATPSVGLDQVQVSQGLVTDTTSAVDYDLIAGKDTAVRAQLYSHGALRAVTRYTVQVQKISAPFGPVQTIIGTPVGSRRLNAGPFGAYAGTGNFQAWIPGSVVSSPGEYRFTAYVNVEGSDQQQYLDLGSRTFLPSGDFRIVLAPVNNRANGDFRVWTNALFNNILPVLQDMNRMFPLRTGVRSVTVDYNHPRSTEGGLRFLLLPVVDCQSSENSGDCDRRARALANDSLNRINAISSFLDAFSPLSRPRERFDRAGVMAGSTGTGGGQAQNSWSPPSAGVGFDANPNGSTAVVMAQEFAHCVGEVPASSPNSFPGDAKHSRNATIPLYRNFPAINFLTQADITRPHSVMYPYFNSTTDFGYNTFMEGWEWNHMRTNLVSRSQLQPAGGRAETKSQLHPKTDGKTLFYFVGGIDTNGGVTVDYTQKVTDLPLELSPEDQQSPYTVEFRDKSGNFLSGRRFAFDSAVTEHDADDLPPAVEGLILTALLPEGAHEVEIRKDGQVLFAREFSEAPPVVSNVVAKDSGKGTIDLYWQTDDQDSQQLTHNVFYLSEPGGVRILIAAGLQKPSFTFSTALIPSTTQGALVVESSDGFNVGEGTSNPFAVQDKPPIAMITQPEQQAGVIAGQPVVFRAVAYDVTAGVLEGDQLEWSEANGGVLGTGERLVTVLTPGQHFILLKAKAPSGLTAAASVFVFTLQDTDGDGLPDDYENAHADCMNAKVADADDDADGDGVPNRLEWIMGTDPCNPDTDEDGVLDGDELRLGSDPRDRDSLPLPDLLFVSDETVNLQPCVNGPSDAKLFVDTLFPQVAWNALTATPWLTVSPGGIGNGTLTLSADCTGLAGGLHTGQVLITVPGGQSRMVPVQLMIPVGTPSLSSQFDGKELRLSWPSAYQDFSLQLTARPEDANSWQDAIGEVVNEGDKLTFRPSLDLSREFFRLIQK